ncbi:tRNA-(ms[2]io[6]A)-hydroxylase [Acaryochloris sp. IP29b_bin.148]|uniref:tRNA-(ms[2]io[6]A)-hydroxylase n=1 Tax=Acaryochloris sp. IP29b_bin.148 TaxID=2969218 RepID=UPI0026057753|nr:tRNA-(ms[2]io[6]A)-hydroxylase [Acaryochloris sp. IP29b_bin.148]
MTIPLKCDSSEAWLQAVLADFNTFLLDHAANEKKASGVALNLAAHYPDKPDLVTAMIDLAIEELSHYRDVFKLIRERHLSPLPDQKDVYVNQLRSLIRKGSENYFLDRLLIAAIIEARGLERFTKIAIALPNGPLKGFYQAIAHSEARHATLFLTLAEQYCASEAISPRLETLLTHEAQILTDLPHRAMLH